MAGVYTISVQQGYFVEIMEEDKLEDDAVVPARGNDAWAVEWSFFFKGVIQKIQERQNSQELETEERIRIG